VRLFHSLSAFDPGKLTAFDDSWDEYYERDLNGDEAGEGSDEDQDEVDAEAAAAAEEPPDPSELDSWFDDVGAPAKTLAFLTSTTFPLSPNYAAPKSDEPDRVDHTSPSVLDLGTGNGSALFSLHLQGGYTAARMVGVDYSRKSIELAEKLRLQYAARLSSPSPDDETSTTSIANAKATPLQNVAFYTFDIINEDPKVQAWWPRSDSTSTTTTNSNSNSGFDLVLDKGTFDAISLSSDTIVDPNTGLERRICELYPAKVLDLTKTGGFFLLTSCNWTESEVVSWFTGASGSADSKQGGRGGGGREGGAGGGRFEVYDTIKYPVFEFGGQKGQGVATVCFRKCA
jgi:SAM-dependent methyltransferase